MKSVASLVFSEQTALIVEHLGPLYAPPPSVLSRRWGVATKASLAAAFTGVDLTILRRPGDRSREYSKQMARECRCPNGQEPLTAEAPGALQPCLLSVYYGSVSGWLHSIRLPASTRAGLPANGALPEALARNCILPRKPPVWKGPQSCPMGSVRSGGRKQVIATGYYMTNKDVIQVRYALPARCDWV